MSHTNKAYEFDGDAVENGRKNHAAYSKDSQITFKDDRKSKLSLCIKVLAFLLLASLIALVVVAVLLAEEKDKNSNNVKKDQRCVTADCVTTASNVFSNMDFSADPCEDFYQYACGGWVKDNIIPEDRSSLSTFGLLDDKVTIILKGLLEGDSSDDEKRFIKNAKNMYASCMDTTTINKKGASPLVDLVQSLYGGWPIASASWVESQFDFQKAVTNIFAMNSEAFFNFYVYTDDKNSTKRTLFIDQASFKMPGRKYYLEPRNDSNIVAYEERIAATAQLMLGSGQTVDRSQAAAIVDFEIELAKITVPSEERRDADALYNPITLEDLNKDYGQIINWKSFVNDLFGMHGVNDSIADDEIFINKSPSFFGNLTDLLKKTPMKVKANYLIWQMVFGMASYLSQDFNDVRHEYNKVVYGTKVPSPRYETCTGLATSYAGLAVGRLFIEETFNADSKSEMLEMIDNLQTAFNEIVDEVTWMDQSTKVVAKEKNKYINRGIGYPDYITNDTAMTIIYENYTYGSDDLFANIKGAKEESLKGSLRNLRLPVDNTAWTTAPSTVNAYYSFSKNQIMFPAGILQRPFFNIKNPRSVNYGGIGVVIGHEITHGFDDQGRQYDKNGNLVQWWDKKAVTNFKERAQCLIDQYGDFFYTEANMTLNGVNTQGENIADNGGLKESFKAYRNWVASQGKEEEKLPGVELTHDQLFFLGFAQVWCGKARKASAVNRVLTGVHSPGRFRVIGTLQNSQDFSNAYQCKPGSYMNAAKKCSVW